MRYTRLVLAIVLALSAAVPAAAQSARTAYTRALSQEESLRKGLAAARPTAATRTEARALVARYERIARQHRRTGYADNALFQAATLSADLWAAYGETADRDRALRLFRALEAGFPHSSLVAKARAAAKELPAARLAAAKPPAPVSRAAPAPSRSTAAAAPVRSDVAPERVIPVPEMTPVSTRPVTDFIGPAPVPGAAPAVIRAVSRAAMPDGGRVVIEVDREVAYYAERLAHPDRVFIDLRGAKVGSGVPATQRFESGVVRQIRIGARPDQITRIVLELGPVGRYSVFTLYSPFRLVIDCDQLGAPASADAPSPRTAPAGPLGEIAERQASPPAAELVTTQGPAIVPAAASARTPAVVPAAASAAAPDGHAPGDAPAPLAGRTALPPAPPLTGAPSANLQGRFSLSRQLGLGIGRIVIDPGHGGHDPGARIKGLQEADLVLDVALRLEQLLLKQPGVEVVLTRRTDVFVPLEERTVLANREGADLFLSIHANASRNNKARGIETYFLNFASNREAEEVAARENAASGRTMHALPDIVKAITLNNKLDESRDFATMVQRAMVERLGAANKQVRDLGVKQAPFVVLIGAAMPSILAEISFITNPQEGRLLKTPAYRQRVAEALRDGVMKYQRSLKSVQTVATQE